MITVEEQDPRFRIAASTIEGAGFGLFAATAVPKGSFLEVLGVRVRRGGTADQTTAFADRYKFMASDDDHLVIPIGYGAMVNHAADRAAQNVEIRSQKAKPPEGELAAKLGELPFYSGEVVYYFMRDVAEGEEILGNYGRGFEKRQQAFGGLGEEAQNDEAWARIKAMNLYGLGRLDALLGRTYEAGGSELVLVDRA